jgi:hypothetical protein
MAKSKLNVGYSLSGFLDLDNGTITEMTKEEDKVYDFDNILRQFNGKEVAITIKETSELESIE